MVGGSGERVLSGTKEKIRLLMRMCLWNKGEGRWKRGEGVTLFNAFVAKVFLRGLGNDSFCLSHSFSFYRFLSSREGSSTFAFMTVSLLVSVVSEVQGKEDHGEVRKLFNT